MPVDAVVTRINLSAGKPFRIRRFPLESLTKRTKPGQLPRSQLGPKGLGRSLGSIVEFAISFHSFDIGLGSKLGARGVNLRFTHTVFGFSAVSVTHVMGLV